MPETCPYCRETIEGPNVLRCPSCDSTSSGLFRGKWRMHGVWLRERSTRRAKDHSHVIDFPTPVPPPPLPIELQTSRTLYFVYHGGKQFGPYSLRELQQYVTEKRVAATDLAWTDGMPEWAFVSDIVGNMLQPIGTQAISTTLGGGLSVTPTLPIQISVIADPLPDRLRFGRGFYFLSLIASFFFVIPISIVSQQYVIGRPILLIFAGWTTASFCDFAMLE